MGRERKWEFFGVTLEFLTKLSLNSYNFYNETHLLLKFLSGIFIICGSLQEEFNFIEFFRVKTKRQVLNKGGGGGQSFFLVEKVQ